jgi:hypothetical protein
MMTTVSRAPMSPKDQLLRILAALDGHFAADDRRTPIAGVNSIATSRV